MDVSIIIVNFNTRDLIKCCLTSIYEHTSSVNYEIIVVDNDSKDGSQKMITQRFPEVNLISLKENIGFGAANNIATINSKGKYLFFLNSDTQLLNNVVKIFFDFMETNPVNEKIGAIGSLLLDEKGEIGHSYGPFPKFTDDIFHTIKTYFHPFLKKPEKKLFAKNESSFPVDYIIGADLFIPSVVFNKLGGFDKKFFMFFEETDLQYQMKKHGYNRLLVNGPEIIHFEGSSFNLNTKKSNQRRIYLDQSRFQFYKKNHNSTIYYLFRVIYLGIRFVTFFDFTYTRQERIKYLKTLVS